MWRQPSSTGSRRVPAPAGSTSAAARARWPPPSSTAARRPRSPRSSRPKASAHRRSGTSAPAQPCLPAARRRCRWRRAPSIGWCRAWCSTSSRSARRRRGNVAHVPPGGTLAAYVWDYAGRMELMRHFWDAAIALDAAASAQDEGVRFPLCRPEPLARLFAAAGLSAVATTAIDVPTVFAISTITGSPSSAARVLRPATRCRLPFRPASACATRCTRACPSPPTAPSRWPRAPGRCAGPLRRDARAMQAAACSRR